MKVEILTITRNRPKYFELMTESIRRQSFKDFKWTVVDNQKNESLASITSRVFFNSKADLVGKWDDDMLLPENALERLVEAHRAFHFGFIGPFHFRDEEMSGVQPEITNHNGINIWKRKHIGGNFLIRREDFKSYEGQGTLGLTELQWESNHPNGYLYPFIIADHMQDARSKHHVPEYYNKFGMGSEDYKNAFIRDSKPYLREK